MSQKSIPQTISTSYGDDEQTVPQEYATSVCKMFAQLGAMGVSVLFASGDSGVGGGSCRSNDGIASKKFIPVFPASCGFYHSPITIHVIYLMVVARSLRHDGWWYNWSEPRGGSPLLWRRVFELLCTPILPGRSCLFISSKHWWPILRPLQVCLLALITGISHC